MYSQRIFSFISIFWCAYFMSDTYRYLHQSSPYQGYDDIVTLDVYYLYLIWHTSFRIHFGDGGAEGLEVDGVDGGRQTALGQVALHLGHVTQRVQCARAGQRRALTAGSVISALKYVNYDVKKWKFQPTLNSVKKQ